MRTFIFAFFPFLFWSLMGYTQDQKNEISIICSDKTIFCFKKGNWYTKTLEGKIIKKFISTDFTVIISDKKVYVFYVEGEKIGGENVQDLGSNFLDCQIKKDHVLILTETKMLSFFINKSKVIQCVKKEITGTKPFIVKNNDP